MTNNSDNNKPDSEKYVTHDDVAEMVSFGSTYLKFAVTTIVVGVSFFALLKHYPVATLTGTALLISLIILLIIMFNKIMIWLKNSNESKMNEAEAEKNLNNIAVGYLVSKGTLSKEEIERFKEIVKNKSEASK
ncbi:hypothetical protein EJ576_21775 [Pseudomonas sp. C 49-2]|uniref:hypothetical protein n=1 Tax=Pseudomonas sp. C 49-2 TaxID=2496849 RepID=UPI000F832D37|nr:hypothetical protein [Pseudomonas sp. C 49-2]RTX96357.1 hypothetical protein EJ576_21775 [Pseudomonas sp. C 49-2]